MRFWLLSAVLALGAGADLARVSIRTHTNAQMKWVEVECHVPQSPENRLLVLGIAETDFRSEISLEDTRQTVFTRRYQGASQCLAEDLSYTAYCILAHGDKPEFDLVRANVLCQ